MSRSTQPSQGSAQDASAEIATASEALVLGRRQQKASAFLIAVCACVVLADWGVRRARLQRWISIDRSTPRRQVELSIDINEATWPELTLLPDVSETMARRIVAFREAEGRFQSLDALKQVRGIGPRTLQQVRPYLEPITSVPAVVAQH